MVGNLGFKILYYDRKEALAYSDVYLYPTYSDIRSRFGSQISISTNVALGSPKINIPIISAGMDTVTSSEMASLMALNGGLGEIHRNNTPNVQSELVRIVKERMRIIEKDPPKLPENAKISDATNLLKRRERGYVIVYKGNNYKGYISGIVTNKDFLAGKPDTKLSSVMTPASNGRLFTVKKGTKLDQAVNIMKQKRVEKIPVLDSDGRLFGVYTLKDSLNIEKYPNAALDEEGRLMVGAAIGVHDIDIERALMLVKSGVDVLFLDIAHGHSVYSEDIVKKLKIREKVKTPIIVGNFATKEGVKFAYDIGADGIKVGIGPGYVCKTRNVAGTGVPQVTAILEAYNALKNKKNPPPIIADGGIREPGDLVKAIACGADCVMIGSLFAGTDMSPGDIIRINGKLQKRIRGMASKGVLEDRKKLSDSTTNMALYTPEGREVFTPYQGSTQSLLNEYIGGLRSAMSYAGSHSIKELKNARLIHISSNGGIEQLRNFQ